MGFDKVEHELHGRRKTRNVGLGVVLAAFVVLIMALTVAKVSTNDFTMMPNKEASN